MSFRLDTHDDPPAADAAVVDQGIGDFNAAAAPLHEVRPLAVFARDEAGAVIGGAVGRRWGTACELLQLWVQEGHRGHGLGAALLQAFEARAREHGCRSVQLETFSFQAPGFYERQGYRTAWQRDDFPHGIVKQHLSKALVSGQPETAEHHGRPGDGPTR